MSNLLLLQQEPYECGIACLGMILKYYKSKVDINYLRCRFNISVRGTSIADLVEYSKELNLSSKVYLLKDHQLKTLSNPTILYWNSNHFVILLKYKRNKGFYILDPAVGSYWIKSNKISKHFSNFSIELSPNKSYIKIKTNLPKNFFTTINKTTKLYYNYITIFFLTILLQASILLFPKYIQNIISIYPSHYLDKNIAVNFIIILILIKLSESLLFLFRGLNILLLENITTKNLTKLTYKHILSLPFEYFQKHSCNSTYNKFKSIDKIKETISQGMSQGIIDGAFSILTLVILFIYNLKIGLIIFITSIFYLAINYWITGKAENLNIVQINQKTQENGIILESLTKISAIKLSSNQFSIFNKWQTQSLKHQQTSNKLSILQIALDSFRIALFGLKLIACVLMCIKLIILKILTIEEFYAIVFYLNYYLKNISSITKKWFDIKLCMSHINNVDSIIRQPPEKTSSNISHDYNHIKHKNNYYIKLNNISFRFDEKSPWIINSLTLTLFPRKCLIIFGPSGCGKTTLLKLMMGIMQPTTGKIYYNNLILNSAISESYKNKISCVLQNDDLFSGSIAENIGFFRQNINLDKVIECSKLACIHKEIIEMPMGYNSYIDASNKNISGGQKQRILLARALYSEPEILFLDEAFSNIDTETETKLNNNIKKLNITRIIITHRARALEIADKVIDMQQLKLKPLAIR